MKQRTKILLFTVISSVLLLTLLIPSVFALALQTIQLQDPSIYDSVKLDTSLRQDLLTVDQNTILANPIVPIAEITGPEVDPPLGDVIPTFNGLYLDFDSDGDRDYIFEKDYFGIDFEGYPFLFYSRTGIILWNFVFRHDQGITAIETPWIEIVTDDIDIFSRQAPAVDIQIDGNIEVYGPSNSIGTYYTMQNDFSVDPNNITTSTGNIITQSCHTYDLIVGCTGYLSSQEPGDVYLGSYFSGETSCKAKAQNRAGDSDRLYVRARCFDPNGVHIGVNPAP